MCDDIQNEPDEDHTEVASSSVSQGTVPKMPSKVFTSFPSKPENAQPFQSSDDLKNLDSTYTDKPIIDFDFPSLDLDQSVFTSEDHAEILMQADDLLHAAKCQLLNMQLGMTFEEKRFEAERQSSTSLYMSDDNKEQKRDLTNAAFQGNESDSKTHFLSRPLSSSKQNESKLTGSEEWKKEKTIPMQDNLRNKPTSFTKQACVTNKHPSNSDIQKEIRVSQDSLQGALSAAKAVSAILEVRAGRGGKEVKFHNSEEEFEKSKKIKSQAGQFHNSEEEFEKSKKIKSQAGQDNQIQNGNAGLHLTSQVHTIPGTGAVSQSRTKDKNVLHPADMPACSLNVEKHSAETHVCVDTKLVRESQTRNDHSKTCSCGREQSLAYVASQVKRQQRKLRSEDKTALKNTGTKVLKSALKNDNSSSQHKCVCSCSKEKALISPCTSAPIHVEASFPSEVNLGNRTSQAERRLVVQALPSLSIKRGLSVQKVPSVSIPSPGAPSNVSQQQNVGLCKISHSQIQLNQTVCTSKNCGGKRDANKSVLKAKPKLQDGYRQYTHHEHTSSSTPKDETRKHSEQEERNSGGSRASSVSGKRSKMTYRSPRKEFSPKEYHSWCKRCRNNFPVRDLYYGMCGKCRNIPSPSQVKQLMCDPTPDVMKAAACLDQCRTCLRHFTKSELFHGHCIQCQIVRKEMRLIQCNTCLNSVPSTEYINGKCNHCHHGFKSAAQKDELDAHPVFQGPAMDRILNTVLDEMPFLFNISKAQCIDRNPSSSVSVQKNKQTNALLRVNKKETNSYIVQELTMKTSDSIANDETRKNNVKNSKARFAKEYFNHSGINKGMKSMATPLQVSRQNDKQAVKFQNLESDDDCEFHSKIRTDSECQETSHTRPAETELLSSSSGLRNYDEKDISSNSNGSIQIEAEAVYDSSKNDGGNTNSDIDGYKQDFECGSKSSDTELEVPKDNGGYSGMNPSAPAIVRYNNAEQETQIAEIQTTIQDLPNVDQKSVSRNLWTRSSIVDSARHRLGVSNTGNSDPDKLSLFDAKVLELSDKTDESSNRIYSDKYDDTSESVSDTNIKAESSSRNKNVDHVNVSKTLPNRNRQSDKYCHNDHTESSQAAESHKYSSSESIPHAETGRNVDCSHKCSSYKGQSSKKINFGAAVDKSQQQFFDYNYNKRKHIQTPKIASVKEYPQSPRTVAFTKKSAECRNKSEDYDTEENKQPKLTTMMEDEHVRGILGQAGEGSDNYRRSVHTKSSSADTKTEHISLADDNTSVNGDDVYEDDWEEELEKDDSEEESGSRDDEEEAEPSENVSHVSGQHTGGMSVADNEGALSLYSSKDQQKQPWKSPCARVINPYTTVPREKTSSRRLVVLTPPVYPGKVYPKEYFWKPICVDRETSPLLKCVDKGTSPISIPSEIPVSRETSSPIIPSVEHVHKGSSVSVPDKKCVDIEPSAVNVPPESPMDKASSPIKIPSMEHTDKGFVSTGIQTEIPAVRETCVIISSGSLVDKSSSPVSSPPQKFTQPPCKHNCTSVCNHSVQVGESLHELPLHSAKCARSTPDMQLVRQQTVLPEQAEMQDDTSRTHCEIPQYSHTKVEPIDAAYDIKGIDIETQTDAVREDTRLRNEKIEKIKEKKYRGLACVQSELVDDLSSSSASQQERSIQHEMVPQSSSPSSLHTNTTETTGTTASVSSDQVSASEGEVLVSCAYSVGEVVVSSVADEGCCSSCHTNSHSTGEVWKCHRLETHYTCSEEETPVDSTLHEGQHVSGIQQASRAQIVNGITVRSCASVEDDCGASERTNNFMLSSGVAQIHGQVQDTRRNPGSYDDSHVEYNSHSEGELSEGQVMTRHC